MSNADQKIMGWDIGGVNTKACLIEQDLKKQKPRIISRSFEIWRRPNDLPELLKEMALELGGASHMATTMTAELSDAFETKIQGVDFILKSMAKAFPDSEIWALDLNGEFNTIEQALVHPLDFAANNWMASALRIAQDHPDCLLMDMGSTTLDIIPIIGGVLANKGKNDTERLIHGELVYTGALRSNCHVVCRNICYQGRLIPLADEYFAIMADVYTVLGLLKEQDYTCPTPDGRGKTADYAYNRLVRLVCGDKDQVTWDMAVIMARYIFEKQLELVTRAWFQVVSGIEYAYKLPLLLVGEGAFVLKELAKRQGLKVLEQKQGQKPVSCLPALAVAELMAQKLV